jgi:hypothetical protein
MMIAGRSASYGMALPDQVTAVKAPRREASAATSTECHLGQRFSPA